MDTAIVVVLILCALAYVISRVRRIARPGAAACGCGCSTCQAGSKKHLTELNPCQGQAAGSNAPCTGEAARARVSKLQ